MSIDESITLSNTAAATAATHTVDGVCLNLFQAVLFVVITVATCRRIEQVARLRTP